VRATWVVAVAGTALALSACSVGPERVPGVPAPLAAVTPSPSASRPPPRTEPSGTAVEPTQYVPYTFRGQGVTATVPVPANWSLTKTPYGADFGDPSGRLLLRLEIRERTAGDAVRGWELYEPELSERLTNYRRVDLVAVSGYGDSAADLTFTFDRDGPRRVIDRSVLSGQASIAIYFSAEQAAFDRTSRVFSLVADGLTIT
jgi:eukaryotic-like serine/threonine-protein kinase